jgi:hypothetical protein
MHALARLLIGVAAVTATACSTSPGGSAPPVGTPPATVTPTVAATAPATAGATTDAAATPASAAPTEAPPVATTPPATSTVGSTTFTLVLADGPREGTWEVSEPGGAVPNCKYLPDLERWIATWLGTPPLSFIDVRGEGEDPFLLFTFTADDESEELSFTPSGDVTFEADDRGDTATLTWVSESNDGTYFDSGGNNTGSEQIGQAELTIECGSIFRYT